jgi:hypothetical protein
VGCVVGGVADRESVEGERLEASPAKKTKVLTQMARRRHAKIGILHVSLVCAWTYVFE